MLCYVSYGFLGLFLVECYEMLCYVALVDVMRCYVMFLRVSDAYFRVDVMKSRAVELLSTIIGKSRQYV